jgi:hypothetical protein
VLVNQRNWAQAALYFHFGSRSVLDSTIISVMVKSRIVFLMIVFLALQFILLNSANAEYRVYLLGIKATPKSREVKVFSTLDNLQYQTYYKMSPAQETRLIDHWMCRGRTNDFKKLCSKPVINQAGVRVPASAQGLVPAGATQQTNP